MEDQDSLKAGKVHSSGERLLSQDALVKDLTGRKFKFRAWDTVGKIMINHSPHMNELYLRFDGLVVEIDREGAEEPITGYVLMQFTGILDKNGKDVYEGDVVRHHKYGGDHVIAWHADSTGFFVGEQSWPLTKLCTPHIEVVGNVLATVNEPAQEMETQKLG